MGQIRKSPTYENADIHLCEGCRKPIRGGHDIVTLSEGHTDSEGNYWSENRRCWHKECWPTSSLASNSAGGGDE